ncbi:primosomal protein N', partial [Campylobacter sp. CH185]
LLVAGARSALFLPFRNLGLIVVDEEHDNSYKASNQPFINARDLALFLGQKNNIKVVLGSATPSLTSFYKQKSFRLKGTFFESKKHFLYDENELGITPMLLSELEKSLKHQKQAIVFLPTRA